MDKYNLKYFIITFIFTILLLIPFCNAKELMVDSKNEDSHVVLNIQNDTEMKKIYIYKRNTDKQYVLFMIINSQNQKKVSCKLSTYNLTSKQQPAIKVIAVDNSDNISEKVLILSDISNVRTPIPSISQSNTNQKTSSTPKYTGMTSAMPTPVSTETPTKTPSKAPSKTPSQNPTKTPSPSPTKTPSTPSPTTSNSPINVSSGLSVKHGKHFKYYQIIPDNPTENMPLIVFLHGVGEGGNFKKLGKLPIVKYVSSKKAYEAGKFIFIAPQSTNNSWQKKSTEKKLIELIETVAKEYKIDKNRIILTGMSQGGYGTWHTTKEYPNYFAAIVPMSGYPSINVKSLVNTPIWAICGDVGSKEKKRNRQMREAVKKINKASGKNLAKFETIHGARHGTVQNAYKRLELFKWMLAQSK